MWVPEMIIVNILKPHLKRVSMPSVYEASTSLICLSRRGSKGYQMDARISKIVDSKSSQGISSSIIDHIASNAIPSMHTHAIIELNILLLESVSYGNLGKTRNKF
jgi:hypothetical protein